MTSRDPARSGTPTNEDVHVAQEAFRILDEIPDRWKMREAPSARRLLAAGYIRLGAKRTVMLTPAGRAAIESRKTRFGYRNWVLEVLDPSDGGLTTIDEFLASNRELDLEDLQAVIRLAPGGRYTAGGGASGTWSVRRGER